MTPRWSVLIAHLGWRRDKFSELLGVLLPQVMEAGVVEVVACHNHGERALGSIRQALLESARGEYVSFVDDDDMVPADFVQSLLTALASGPDVVAFQMLYTHDGVPGPLVDCSIRHEPHDSPIGLYRDLTHIQPIRAELARLGDFRVGWPEDSTWAAKVRPHVRTETYLPRRLYHYRHDSQDTVQGPWRREGYVAPLEVTGVPCFRWLPVSDVPR